MRAYHRSICAFIDMCHTVVHTHIIGYLDPLYTREENLSVHICLHFHYQMLF
jgi:hypothetical protein